jgi:uncharacterized protein DUF4157
MKSPHSKNSKPTNSNHSPFFQKESSNHLFENNSKSFFNASSIDTKLTVNQPGDPYEKEADAMAYKVVQRFNDKSFSGSENNPAPFFNKPNLTVQRKCAECEQEEELQKKEDQKITEQKIQKKPIFESNAEPNDEEKNIHRKCAACEKEEKVQKKPLIIQKQEETESSLGDFFHQPASDWASSATSETGSSSPAPEGQTATNAGANQQGHFIVDDAAIPSDGQMRKSDFLQRVTQQICEVVDSALQGTPFSSNNCPYIQAAFARYQNSSPAQIEQKIKQYEPAASSAQNAEDLIQQVKTYVGILASRWAQTRDLSSVPQDILAQIPDSLKAASGIANAVSDFSQSVSSGIGSIVSGAGSIFFKANDGGAQATQSPASVMQSLGKGNSIDGSTRSKMENAFGANFSDVEIHTDSNAANLSKNMNARAFAIGNHIAFGSGEHNPGTLVGDALMAHELAHTIQQSRGKVDSMQMKGSADYSALEEDADISAMGAMISIQRNKKGTLLKMDKKANPKMKSGLSITSCKKNVPHTPCTTMETTSINSYRTRGSGWTDAALIKLRQKPVRADVLASLQKNFGPVLGVEANLPGIIQKIVAAQAGMNASAYYCAGTEDSMCAQGFCGYSYAGGNESMICRNSTLASSDEVYQSGCLIHESYHATFSSFDSDSYSGWNGHSGNTAGYPGADPLNNADSYASLIIDLK